MSGKEGHKKHHQKDNNSKDQIPQWAQQQIRPEDDPFHNDFEMEIVLDNHNSDDD